MEQRGDTERSPAIPQIPYYVSNEIEVLREANPAPASADESDAPTSARLTDLPDEIIVMIFHYLGAAAARLSLTCKRLSRLYNSSSAWIGQDLLRFTSERGIMRAFRFLGLKRTGTEECRDGTEGTCFKSVYRGDGKVYALRRARIHPEIEGVPYYVLRELQLLRGLRHPNVSSLEAVHLKGSRMTTFFPYSSCTMLDTILRARKGLPKDTVKRFMYQIARALTCIHARGAIHRNVKPKHFMLTATKEGRLVPAEATRIPDYPQNEAIPSEEELNTCVVTLCDFALARTSCRPFRHFTQEVVTLWYRAPELLMGGTYDFAVDVWSMGCIFAELTTGQSLLPGSCAIDQLYQIFRKLGTPDEESWPGFLSLPHVSFEYPTWPRRGLRRYLPREKIDDDGIELLERMLQPNPAARITAPEALQHPYFDEVREELETLLRGVEEHAARDVPHNALRRALHDPECELRERWSFRRAEQEEEEEEALDATGRPLLSLADRAYARHCRALDEVAHEVPSALWPAAAALPAASLQPERAPAERGGFATPRAPPAAVPPTVSPPLPVTNWQTAIGVIATPRGNVVRLSPANRALLVNWFYEVVTDYEMSLRTVFLAVDYLDRYVAEKSSRRPTMMLSSLRMLGAVCLHIASKCEDVSYISVTELVRTLDHAISPQALLLDEENVLNRLDFRLDVATSLDFARLSLEALRQELRAAPSDLLGSHALLHDLPVSFDAMVIYLCQVATHEPIFNTLRASIVAHAALLVAVSYFDVLVAKQRSETAATSLPSKAWTWPWLLEDTGRVLSKVSGTRGRYRSSGSWLLAETARRLDDFSRSGYFPFVRSQALPTLEGAWNRRQGYFKPLDRILTACASDAEGDPRRVATASPDARTPARGVEEAGKTAERHAKRLRLESSTPT